MNASSVFLVRLIPPRSDFPQTMTADEAAVMHEHVAYWREHLARGSAIVFGPVADPQGVWGLGIVRVADEGELRTYELADPAIAAQIGFRYEVLPMPGAFLVK